MPIYEYACNNCHNHFELMQKLSDTTPQTCPHCQGNNVQRLVSAAGFQLKGSGWYATDFKHSKKTDTSCSKPECGQGQTCASNKDKSE